MATVKELRLHDIYLRSLIAGTSLSGNCDLQLAYIPQMHILVVQALLVFEARAFGLISQGCIT